MPDVKLFFARLSILLSDMSVFALVMLLFFHREEIFPVPPFGVWAAGILLGLAGNTWIRKRQGSVNASIFFTAGLGSALGVFLVWHLLQPSGFSFWPAVSIFALGAGSIIHGAVLVGEKWNYNQETLYLDGLILAAAFLLLMERVGTFSDVRAYLCWTFAAIVLDGAVLLLYRTGDTGLSAGGPLLMLLVLGGLAWLAGTRLQPAAKKLAGAALMLWRTALGLLRAAGGLLLRFLGWLFGLFPGGQEEVLLPEAREAAPEMPNILPGIPGPDPVLLAAAACLAAIAAGILIWRRFRGRRWRLAAAGSASELPERREHRRGRLLRALEALLERLRFALGYLLHRNSPEGLLTCAERQLGRAGAGRGAGESAPGFLRRAAGLFPEMDEGCLGELADCLERNYYGEGREMPEPGFARRCRRALRRACSALRAADAAAGKKV